MLYDRSDVDPAVDQSFEDKGRKLTRHAPEEDLDIFLLAYCHLDNLAAYYIL